MADYRMVNSAKNTLLVTYGILAILAGIDKFFYILVDWRIYLSSFFQDLISIDPNNFFYIIGGIEIFFGILLFTRYKLTAAYFLGIWFLLIALNLILAGYFDIAVRDIVIAIGAFSLGELIKATERNPYNV